MSLARIVAELAADFDARAINADVVLGKPGVQREFSRLGRIVVSPTVFAVDAPTYVGGNPAPVAESLQTLRVYVWAKSAEGDDGASELTAAEALRDAFILSFFSKVQGSHDWGSGAFTDASTTDTFGAACVFDVKARIPVVGDELTSVTDATGVNQTKAVFPSGEVPA